MHPNYFESSMKKLINRLIGTTENFLFEQVLYNGMCFFAFTLAIVLTIVNIIYQTYNEIIYALPVTAFLGTMYYLAKFKNRYYPLTLYIFTIVLTGINYFRNLGIHGPISFYFLVIFIFALAYSPVRLHVKVFVLQLLFIAIATLIELVFPKTILNPYQTPGMLYGDLVLGIFLGATTLFFGINFLRRSYDTEREKNYQQKAQLEKNSHERTMFFINLSHEIKTPLTLVENYLEKYIQDKGEDEKLKIIHQNVKKMRRDILEYLSVEKIEMGNDTFEELTTILLSKYLLDKIKQFDDYTRNKGVKLVYTVMPQVFIKTNGKGIEQVLNNLLENAAKYTPRGFEITVILKKEDSNGKLIIQNSGVIIPEEKIIHLFEPFYQLSHEKLNQQGVGMGLYIVKKVLDNTGGQIEVESNNEIGVRFTVTMPLSNENEITEQVIENYLAPIIPSNIPVASDSPYDVNKQNILVVEDNNELLSYLVSELQTTYNVFVADNGKTAMDRLQKIPIPEIIISDIMMDKMDGYEFLKISSTFEEYSYIPFIFLTAKNEPKIKNDSYELGALDFITKPFSIEELKLKIKVIITQKQRISKAAIKNIKTQFTNEVLISSKDRFANNANRYNLTQREKEVVQLVKEGLKYEEIAQKLHISEHTVNRHIQNIYEKTFSNSKLNLLEKLYN